MPNTDVTQGFHGDEIDPIDTFNFIGMSESLMAAIAENFNGDDMLDIGSADIGQSANSFVLNADLPVMGVGMFHCEPGSIAAASPFADPFMGTDSTASSALNAAMIQNERNANINPFVFADSIKQEYEPNEFSVAFINPYADIVKQEPETVPNSSRSTNPFLDTALVAENSVTVPALAPLDAEKKLQAENDWLRHMLSKTLLKPIRMMTNDVIDLTSDNEEEQTAPPVAQSTPKKNNKN